MPDDAQPWSVAWSRAVLEPGGFYRRDAGHAEDHFPTFVTRDARTARRIAAIAAPALLRLAADGTDPTVTDVGAADGTLLHQLMAELPAGLVDVVRWRAIDIRDRPEDADDRIEWIRADARTVAGRVKPAAGLLVAHELLDDVPCDVVETDDDGRLRLVLVDPRTGAQRLGPGLDEHGACRSLGVDAERSLAWIEEWWHRSEPAARIEVGWQRDDAWTSLTRLVTHGIALAVDYGHVRAERLAGQWDGGTLVGYRRGRATTPVPDGSCNLTAHVAIDSCAAAVDAAATRLDRPDDGDGFWWLAHELAR